MDFSEHHIIAHNDYLHALQMHLGDKEPSGSLIRLLGVTKTLGRFEDQALTAASLPDLLGVTKTLGRFEDQEEVDYRGLCAMNDQRKLDRFKAKAERKAKAKKKVRK